MKKIFALIVVIILLIVAIYYLRSGLLYSLRLKQPGGLKEPTPTNFVLQSISGKSNAIPLTFGNQTYYLVSKNVSYDQSNWPALPSRSFDVGVTSTSQIYSNPDWSIFKWYNPTNDTYYILEPSGQKEISLKDSSYIDSLLKGKTVSLPEAGTRLDTSCIKNTVPVGSINALSVSCKTAVFLSENNQLMDESNIANCYFPISNSQYIAFEQTVLPASSSYDMCQELSHLEYSNLGN